ncbi:MAG: hypothetical protein AseanaTS_26750 [Candidatus Pelagadaptatus aseana]|uniref:hypothetical protein n=1 Tax=Candidatus Pelagadaptatus aseana TaxID=3120508 RepID=UPI0039B23E0E
MAYKGMKVSAAVLSVALALLLSAAAGAQDNPKVVHFGCGMKDSNRVFQEIDKALSAVFTAMGYEFHMTHFPRIRVEAELESGRLDGICGKTRHYFENSDVALPLSPPVSMGHLVLFGRDDSKGLSEPDVRLLYVRGSSSVRAYLDQAKLTAEPITTIYQGLKMVAAKRVDYLIEFAGPGRNAINELGLEVQITSFASGYQLPVMMVVHKRYRHLIPEIEQRYSDYMMTHHGREILIGGSL